MISNEHVDVNNKHLLTFYTNFSSILHNLHTLQANREGFYRNASYIYLISEYEKSLTMIINLMCQDDKFNDKLKKLKLHVWNKEIDTEKIFFNNNPSMIIRILLFEEDVKKLKHENTRITCKPNLDDYGRLLYSLEREFIERRNSIVHRSDTADETYANRIKKIFKTDNMGSYLSDNNLIIKQNDQLITTNYIRHTITIIFNIFFYILLTLSNKVQLNIIERYLSFIINEYLIEYHFLKFKPRAIKKEYNAYAANIKSVVDYFLDSYDLSIITDDYLLPVIFSYYYATSGYNCSDDSFYKIRSNHGVLLRQTPLGKLSISFHEDDKHNLLDNLECYLNQCENKNLIYEYYLFYPLYNNDSFNHLFFQKFRVDFSQEYSRIIKRLQEHNL